MIDGSNANLKGIESILPLVAGVPFQVGGGFLDFDGRDLCDKSFKEGSHYQAGMRGSEAEMGAEPE